MILVILHGVQQRLMIRVPIFRVIGEIVNQSVNQTLMVSFFPLKHSLGAPQSIVYFDERMHGQTKVKVEIVM